MLHLLGFWPVSVSRSRELEMKGPGVKGGWPPGFIQCRLQQEASEKWGCFHTQEISQAGKAPTDFTFLDNFKRRQSNTVMISISTQLLLLCSPGVMIWVKGVHTGAFLWEFSIQSCLHWTGLELTVKNCNIRECTSK